MRHRFRIVHAWPLLTMPLLASCVAPPAVRAPVATPPIAAVVAPPPPVAQDWTDGPVAAGSWSYRAEAGGSLAAFAAPDGTPLFALRCAAPADIALTRTGGAAALTVTTTGPARTLPVDAQGAAHVSPRDPFLDAIAFSRGRMLVRAAPAPAIVLPVQAEISRVIEDCRG